jgi:protein TonB
MRHGGLIDEMGQEHRRVLLPSSLSGARVLALGASAALHLLAIATLASILDYRSGLHIGHSPTLTVISLAPDRPAVEPASPLRPERHGSLPERASSASPARPIAISGAPAESPAFSASSAAPAPVEAGRSSQGAATSQDTGPRHPAEEPDAALREYQAMLWRLIDANRPRGVNMKGAAVILFRLSADGTLEAAQVSRTSGNILLDKIALRSVRQAAPFPRPPGDLSVTALTFEIPINFH